MAQLEQRLTFQGDCEDAIDLYVSAFDANITSLIRYGDTGAPHPVAMARKIASAELVLHDTTLHLADGYGDDERGNWPTVGIALLLPGAAMRQAIAVLSGPRSAWWVDDETVDTSTTVDLVDAHGVLWCLGTLPPLAA